MKKLLITGGTGFVAGHLLRYLAALDKFRLRASVRNLDQSNHLSALNCEQLNLGDLTGATDWRQALNDIECVIHCAGYAHEKTGFQSAQQHEEINFRGTINLANQAAAAGVKRFIFLSSIKVNGEMTTPGQAFTPEDTPQPQTAYGIAKYNAECGLRELAKSTPMEVVIIRPCLIYGPGAKANFQALMKWVAAGIPLPLQAVNNKRSFLAIENLTHFIATCVTHPRAANEIFLLSDGQDLSTPELIQEMALAMGRPARLFPMPNGSLTVVAALLGKGDLLQRLRESLCVDITKNKILLDWEPPLSVQQGMITAVLKSWR